MAATLQSLGFAVSGAVLMQLLPGLLMQSQVTGAMWGWAGTPVCKPAAGSNWAFSATVNAGTSGTIVCTTMLASPPAAGSTVACPSSTGDPSSDNDWSSTCGSGKGVCKAEMEIGKGLSCTGGMAGMAAATTVAPSTAVNANTTDPDHAAMLAAATTKPATAAVSFADGGATPGLFIAVAALANLL
ncbi:unnamed protein product [Polarella glacialis]|uniref:Uncharacterized protein n=1 Tax=Polarella glacialis TaxID=89957 RepID=A0A813LUK2_POLGL|nr:unnamed protein product [Polarella glacialis]